MLDSNQELLKVMLNLRRARAALRDAEIEDIERMADNIKFVLGERLELKAQDDERNAERNTAIEAIRQQMSSLDICIDELISNAQIKSKSKSKRPPRPAKYAFTDSNGNQTTWTGQGRMPKPMREQVDSGVPLESFAISAE